MRTGLWLGVLVLGIPAAVATAYTFGPGPGGDAALGSGDVIMVGAPLLYLLATLALAVWLERAAGR